MAAERGGRRFRPKAALVVAAVDLASLLVGPPGWQVPSAAGRIAATPSIDRQRGTLLGLVIGDALGAAVEFQPPGSFSEVTGYCGGGLHGLAPGEWTDDTSMVLALADSIASIGWDLNDQVRRYVAGGGRANTRSTAAASTSASQPAAPCFASSTPAMPRPPVILRNRPAATARSCGWPRCRSAMPTCFLANWKNWSGTSSSPVCRHTPAPSACRPARTWAWCWRC